MSDAKVSPNYITQEGFLRLQEEFHRLFREERPKLVETIAWAAGNGDRSENGDYIYGKRRLREIDKRLKFLRDRIEAAHVVDVAMQKGFEIRFGATVEVEDEEGEIKVYQIVGEDETDPAQNRISWRSPVAKALLGKMAGDEVQVRTPKKQVLLSVIRVFYTHGYERE